MIQETWVGDVPENDKEVLLKWLLKRNMKVGDTMGDYVQLPNGNKYNFKIFREAEQDYEVTFERSC